MALALVAGLWLVPEMLDWGRFRDDIAALATERLGRPVQIGGGVSLQLLPQPALTAHDVVVADTGDGARLQAKALRLAVSLPALLRGALGSSDLVLQGAELRLPWPLPASLGGRSQAWFAGLRARVVDSRVQVGGMVLAAMDAALATDPDTGTLSVAGTATPGMVEPPANADPRPAEPARWRFTARLAQPGNDGAMPLDLSLDGQAGMRDTGGTFSGRIAGDGSLAGRVAARGPDLSLLLPAPAQPWRADGRLGASGGLAVADELALEVGGIPARGTVALRVGQAARLDVSVTAGRLDGDAWAPVLLHGGALTPTPTPTSAAIGIPIGLDLSAEAVTLAGGTVRTLRGAIDLPAVPGGGIALRDVSAILPGGASLLLSGSLGAGGARFEGTTTLKAPDLRATLGWASPWLLPASVLPSGVLRQFEGTARLGVDASQLSMTDLVGTLDGAAVAGTLALRRAARPGVTADLVFGALQLDPWLPASGSESPDVSMSRAVATLRGLDTDVKLGADAAEWMGVPLGALSIELASDSARVSLRRLAARPLGMRLSASGAVAADGRFTDVRLDLSTPDIGLLRPVLTRLASPPGPLDRLLRGAGTLSVQAAGPPEALAGRVVAEAADVRIDLQPVVNLPGRQAAGTVALHHPGAPRLLEALGLRGAAAWLGDGSFSLVGQVAVDPGRIELLDGTLTAGALRMSGRLGLAGRRLTGDVAAETLPLPLPYPRSPDPLPFGWLPGWSAAVRLQAAEVLFDLAPALRSLSVEIGLDGGVATLGRVTAQALGATLTGTATVDAAAVPPRVSVAGAARGLGITGPVLDTQVDLVAGLADVTLEGTGTGYSPAALLATATATAAATVTEATVSGFDGPALQAALAQPDAPETVAAAQAALRAGSTAVRKLEASLVARQGGVSLDGTMAGAWGDARLSGTLDLTTTALDGRLLLRPAAPGTDGPELGLRLSGTLGRSRRSVDVTGLLEWLRRQPGR